MKKGVVFLNAGRGRAPIGSPRPRRMRVEMGGGVRGSFFTAELSLVDAGPRGLARDDLATAADLSPGSGTLSTSQHHLSASSAQALDASSAFCGNSGQNARTSNSHPASGTRGRRFIFSG